MERVNYDYTVSPTVLIHLGAGYQQNDFFDDAPVINYNAAQPARTDGRHASTATSRYSQGLCTTATGCPTAAGGTMNMGPAGQDPQLLGKAIRQRQPNVGSRKS